MINPTGKGTRYDKMGSGDYLAKRGSRKHKGRDYLVAEPGDPVFAPITGTISKVVYPYKNDMETKGVIIQGESLAIRLYYVDLENPVGSYVRKGEQIGTAQDLSKKHGPNMKSHVHCEIESMDPDILINLRKAILGG